MYNYLISINEQDFCDFSLLPLALLQVWHIFSIFGLKVLLKKVYVCTNN